MVHALACLIVVIAIVGLPFILPRKTEPPQPLTLVVRNPPTLEQAVRNSRRVDEYVILQIREEQHALRQVLDQADLDSPDAEAPFNVVPIESAALRQVPASAAAKRKG